MRIAVLLSGGVDSSVALKLLQREGEHDLTAFYLKIWLEDELRFLGDCPWEEDLHYVRTCCSQLHVPLEIIPLQSEYREAVVNYALAELKRGNTPSPDVFCNRRIKFGAFVNSIEPGYDLVATGHYAQRVSRNDLYCLARSPDAAKDQTYFLSRLTQSQLARAFFPLGNLTKRQVRRMAATAHLPTAQRPDSQGICFLGRIQYRDFVRFHLGERTGAIRDQHTHALLGEHRGYWFYTIGQRFGLGLGGGPWYVTGKDVETNTLYVAHRDRPSARERWNFQVRDVHWIAEPPGERTLAVKLRHGPDLVPCCIQELPGMTLAVELCRPDPGIAPGQLAVFYQGEVCLGSGIITELSQA